MHRLITAFANVLPDGASDGPPGEIVYLPEGEHRIRPFVDGKPKDVTVRVPPELGAEIAAALQGDLEARMGGNVRPTLDFDHLNTGPAAGLPKGFRYEPGKGVMLAADWTRSGKEAIEGRDFSYFSPSFLMDEDGVPAAPETGTTRKPSQRVGLAGRILLRDAPRSEPPSRCPSACSAMRAAR